MRVKPTPTAERTVSEVAASGRENLLVVIGTGCCDSTAPYLFDNHYPGPDVVEVGEVSGVKILAPAWLAKARGEAELVLDCEPEQSSDSMSLECELGLRMTLRLAG
ncbi:MAG: DUF779 domain-containing protein [Actinomycetota bacterium]